MKESTTDDFRQLLPELFGPADLQKKRPNGMCTPESGCDPLRQEAATDILRILSKNGPAETAASPGE